MRPQTPSFPYYISAAGFLLLTVSSTSLLPYSEVQAIKSPIHEVDEKQSVFDLSSHSMSSERSRSEREIIAELKNVSGLTWDQTAALFAVSRRTIHFWLAGGSINSKNAEKIQSIWAEMLLHQASMRETLAEPGRTRIRSWLFGIINENRAANSTKLEDPNAPQYIYA